ncbi:MAG TPA: tryptophan synthase subunit alpha [Polyangia bacterium]|nr:tryptophan synthase subunit alpha [Polyangia bacterium]
MSRIAETFEKLRGRGERALVAYVTAGDPDLARSRELACALADAGVDVLELGVPFSDPNADGPAIQAAMGRALAAGATLAGVLELCADLRRQIATPVVLFGYYNPVFVHGCARFAAEAAAAGADGALVVDLPPEEADELLAPLRAHGLDFVPLVAPTSTEERILRAARAASGFVYYVSLTGVTGAALSDLSDVEAHVRALRSRIQLPIAVGFGVSTPADARRIGGFADAVVVGSAIVRAAERGGAAAAAELARSLKQALR